MQSRRIITYIILSIGILCNVSANEDSLYEVAFKGYRNGVFELSELSVQQILKENQLRNDLQGECEAWIYLAEFRRGAQQLSQALTAANRSIRLLKSAEPYDTSLAAFQMNRKASILYEMGEIDSALWYTRAAIHLDKLDNDQFYISSNYNLLGACYREIGKSDSSLFYLMESLRIAKQEKDTSDVISSALNLAVRFEHDDKLCDSTYKYAKIAYEAAKNSPYKSRLYSIYNYLGASLQCLGEFEKALFYKNRESTIKDSLRNENTLLRIESLSALHNLQYQEQKNQTLIQKIRNRNIIGIGVGIVIILLIGLVLYDRRRIKQIQDLMHQLSGKTQELERSNKLKDKMFSILAHDLRSPMSALSTVLYLLREDNLSREETDSLIQQLSARFQNTEMLLDNLLYWSRLHIKGIEIQRTKTDVDSVSKKEIDYLSDAAREKDIDLELNTEIDMPLVLDDNVLRFILRNLISNAIKFSERNTSISVTLRKATGGLRGIVQDQGVGIPQNKISEIFSSESESTYGTNNERGTGLGLSMCSECARKHEGYISVESEEGKGSRFEFFLKTG